MDCRQWFRPSAAIVIGIMAAGPVLAQDPPVKLAVNWDKVVRVSKTTPTLQVVVNPPLRRGTRGARPGAFKSLRRTCSADYVRYVPWLPYPEARRGRARSRPKDGKTSWDFSLASIP